MDAHAVALKGLDGAMGEWRAEEIAADPFETLAIAAIDGRRGMQVHAQRRHSDRRGAVGSGGDFARFLTGYRAHHKPRDMPRLPTRIVTAAQITLTFLAAFLIYSDAQDKAYELHKLGETALKMADMHADKFDVHAIQMANFSILFSSAYQIKVMGGVAAGLVITLGSLSLLLPRHWWDRDAHRART